MELVVLENPTQSATFSCRIPVAPAHHHHTQDSHTADGASASASVGGEGGDMGAEGEDEVWFNRAITAIERPVAALPPSLPSPQPIACLSNVMLGNNM